MKTSMIELDASIIIPTYNRKDSLKRTLLSLSQQTWPQDRFEVLVVDDGSTDGTGGIFREKFGLTLRYIYQNNKGQVEALNEGAEESSGKVLVFLDDDVIVSPDFVASLVKEHEYRRKTIVLPVLNIAAFELDKPFTKIRLVKSHQTAAPSGKASFTDLYGCCFSVKKQDFYEIGMMQCPSKGLWPDWNDVDFSYRAYKLGYEFWVSGTMVIWHYESSLLDLQMACKRLFNAGRSAVYLFHKYPDLIAYIPLFEDKTPISIKNDPVSVLINKLWHAFNAWRPVQSIMEQITQWLEIVVPQPLFLGPLYKWILSSYVYQGYRRELNQVETSGW